VQGCRLTAATIGDVGQADPIEVVLFEQFALFGGQLGDTRAESLTASIGLVLKPILGVGSLILGGGDAESQMRRLASWTISATDSASPPPRISDPT
jgi:hypothetical protein